MVTLLLTLSLINTLLIIALLIAYLRNMTRTPSSFTIGLALFAGLFLIHNLLVLAFTITMMPLYAAGIQPYITIFTLLQAIAFGILNKVTWT